MMFVVFEIPIEKLFEDITNCLHNYACVPKPEGQ